MDFTSEFVPPMKLATEEHSIARGRLEIADN